MLGILLVEDSDALREALRQGLVATGAVRVVGAVSSGEEAVACCEELADQSAEPSADPGGLPDVVLMASSTAW